MLKITPITDKENQRLLSELCKTEYLADCMAYQILSDGKLIGMVNFLIHGKCGHIVRTALIPGCDDVEAIEIAVRGTMNFIERCSVKEAVYQINNEYDEAVARKIGFRPDIDGVYRIDLENFFNAPCQSCQNCKN